MYGHQGSLFVYTDRLISLCRTDIVRAFSVIVIATILVCPTAVMAQGDPGPNRNLIGLTPDPADIRDTNARQQNEPSCAVRPGNSACIICGYNDYRTVDLFGDGWQGVSQSCDAGYSWLSRVAPGHPNHVAPINAEFAADPSMIAIDGMAIFNFIAGYRDSNVGVVAVQHWLEVNKEDADHYEPGLNTYIVADGSEGRFLDKTDALAVLDPASQQGTINLSTEMENTALGTINRSFPTGTLYVAYAVFTGDHGVKVYYKTSRDWGQTWINQAKKLSEGQNLVSGISMTNIGDTVLAVWRRAGDGNDFDSIMYSFITKGGRYNTKAEVLADICSFDQVSSSSPLQVTFRTNDFPWTANDGKNFYAFYSDRDYGGTGNCANGRPRIVFNHAKAGNKSWQNSPMPVDDAAPPGSFQFMPSAFGARGKVQVAWYDTRREGPLPADIVNGSSDPHVVADYVSNVGNNIHRKVDVFTTRITSDQNGNIQPIPDPVIVSQYRIAAEIRDGELGGTVAIEAEASFGNKKLYASGSLPFLGDYITVAGEEYRLRDDGKSESNSSPIISPALDKTPFFIAWTDNRDVRGSVAMIDDPLPYSPPDVDLPQMSKRLSIGKLGDEAEVMLAATPEPFERTGPPADRSKTAEGLDGADMNPQACVPGSGAYDRSRDSNIYGSVIEDQVRLYAPTVRKPMSGLQRSFVVAMANTDDTPRSFRLEIAGPPEPCASDELCRASFRQQPSVPPFDNVANPPTLLEILEVPPQSSLVRTVFVVGDDENSAVTVNAYDTDCTLYPDCDVPIATLKLGGTEEMLNPDYISELCLLGSTDPACDVLRAEFHNPALINPALINPALINPALINPALINPALINPNLINPALINYYLENPALINPFLINPALINYSLENPALINPFLINPALINPALINTTLENPNLINSNLANPALINSTLDDGTPEQGLTWTDYNFVIQNTGNVTTGYDADVTLEVPEGVAVDTQLIAWSPSFTTTTLDCEQRLQVEANVFATVNNPDNNLEIATIDSPFSGEISALANAGGALVFTFRVFGTEEELAQVRVSGFTAASQAANCTRDVPVGGSGDWFCELLLADQRELIVLDTAPPQLMLPGDITTEAVSIDGAVVTYSVSASDSGDPNPTVSCTPASGSTFPLGMTTVMCTATDAVGNSSTGGFDVIVVDNTPPTIAAPADVTQEATDSETARADIALGNATASDTFGSLTITNNAPASFLVGVTTVTWTATDSSGNESSAPQIVTLTDSTAPDLQLTGFALVTHEAGTPYVDEGAVAFDLVDGMIATVQTAFADGNVPGTYTVTWEATDSRGNTVSIDRTVLVEDNTAPTITAPADVSKEATLVLTPLTPAELGSAVASDAVGVTSVTNDAPAAGFPVGDTVVTWRALDDAGNESSVTQLVTITDTTPPEINVMDGAIFEFEATGPAGAFVDLSGAVTATDKGETLEVTCTTSTGITLPAWLEAGIYSVTCSTTDGDSSITIEIEVIVNVEDLVAPVLQVPTSPVTAVADATTGTAVVDFSSLVTASDNVDENLALTCIPASGTAFSYGSTTVTCTATDDGPNADGLPNSTTGSFVVSVSDNEPPVIVLNGSPSVTHEAGSAYTDAGASAFDAVQGMVVPTIGGALIDESTLPGSYQVIWSAVDASGNIATLPRAVIVQDTTPPVIAPSATQVFEATAAMTPSADVTLTTPAATDAVGVVSLTNNAPGSYPLGDTIVTWTASDAAGLSSTSNHTVRLVDTTAPTILIDSDPLEIETASSPAIVGFLSNLTISDSVDGDIEPVCTPPSGSEFNWGATTVSCSATDDSGNVSSSAAFSVQVRFPYDIRLIVPKGRAQAGSTIPIDWQYLDRTSGQPVDGSSFAVSVDWRKYSGSNCSGSPGDIMGDDSGDSDTRYTFSSNTWQFNWQTPDSAGNYVVTISPPGTNDGSNTDSSACVVLK